MSFYLAPPAPPPSARGKGPVRVPQGEPGTGIASPKGLRRDAPCKLVGILYLFNIFTFNNLNYQTMTTFTIGKYIDPMTDYGFKKIFKNDQHKRLILELLQNVFDPGIADVEFVDSEHLGETEDDRRAYFDVQCRTADGRRFIVEVQLRDQRFFPERAVYYSTFLVAEQAAKGIWDYDFQPVHFLGLMNFDMRGIDPSASKDAFIHRYSLRDDDTHQLLTDRLSYVFMEVARFEKPWHECRTFEEKFLFYMKNLPTFAESPERLEDGGYFEELVHAAEYAALSRDEKRNYLNSVKMKGDYQNTIDFAREQGLEEGFNKGHEAGIAEGREIGVAEGMQKKALETAISLKAAGVDLFIIAEATGLSEAKIATL